MPGHDGDGSARPGAAQPKKVVRAFAAAAAIVTAIWLAAAATWIAGDTVVPWDSKNQFYAFFRFLADSLHSGALPFWNPYHYGGHPSIADPQSLIFAPLFFLWALFDPAPSIRTFDVLVYLHLLIGGLAMAAIGVRARWTLAATVLAAALFMLAGAAAGRLQHTGIILSYGLFPLAWLTLQLAMQKRSIALALCFAASAVTLALGRNQVALLLCYVLVAAAIAEIVSAERPLRYLRERLPVLGVMLVAGTVLLAVPMLLTLQFAELSNRPGEHLDEALKGSLYPANLATLAVADIFGTHQGYWGPNGASLPDVAHTDNSFNYLFVGWLPLILLALVRHRRRRRLAPRTAADHRDAGRGAAVHARPLHAGVHPRLPICARHRHVSAPGGCKLRAFRMSGAAVRSSAHRFRPRRFAEAPRCRPDAAGAGGVRGRCRRDRVLRPIGACGRCADGAGESRGHSACVHHRPRAGPHRARARSRRRVCSPSPPSAN